MRVLITGITGFVGGFLAQECARQGWEVQGTSHGHEPAQAATARDADSAQGAQGTLPPLPEVVRQAVLHRVDLTDGPATAAVFAAARPDAVYHLAAQASVPAAWHDPGATLLNNIAAQLNVLEAARRLERPGLRLLVVSTADVYGGGPPEAMPLREDAPLRPLNPYAVSKATQDMLGYQYYRAYGLHVVRVRPFNHFGPRQRTGFVAADFARQVAEIERGRRAPQIQVGNLSALRDFTDVRDIVRAYVLALRDGEAGAVYNVCSGIGRPIRALLDELLSASTVPISVLTDPERMRPVDSPVVIGDAGALRARVGWTPAIPFETTVRDTLEDWRARVDAAGH